MNKVIISLAIALPMIGVFATDAVADEQTPTAPAAATASGSGEDRRTVSLAGFDVMMQALTHRRCMNCHPSGDRPRQGEDGHLHYYNVRRGPDDHGLAALQCHTCHQKENNNDAGVPGAPHWGLAPRSMAWEGLTRVEIANVMLDPTKNGGKNLTAIVKHLTEDELVLWAWEPGVDQSGTPREKPPMSKEAYIVAVKQWAENGAFLPEE